MQIKLLNRGMYIPNYGTVGSAGLDLCACIPYTYTIESNGVALIPAGIAIHIDNPNIAAVILPRSGLGHRQGIVLGNLVGLIDSDYQGELQISCWNRSMYDVVIHPGDRIAQLVFVPIIKPEFEVVEEFTSETERSSGGFGSTGV